MGKDPRKALLKATHICHIQVRMCSPICISGQKPRSVLTLSFIKALASMKKTSFPIIFLSSRSSLLSRGGHYSRVACSVFPLTDVHTAGQESWALSSLLSDSAPLCLSSPVHRLSILDSQKCGLDWVLMAPEWNLRQLLGALKTVFLSILLSLYQLLPCGRRS